MLLFVCAPARPGQAKRSRQRLVNDISEGVEHGWKPFWKFSLDNGPPPALVALFPEHFPQMKNAKPHTRFRWKIEKG